MTVLTILDIGSLYYLGGYKYFVIIIRLSVIAFLISQGKHILNEMKSDQKPNETSELLDDIKA
jgi:hypothetical protein